MATKNRYFLKLAYKGSNYCGWQVQKNGTSVQGTVNEALSTLFQAQINVVGCGRTDAGVHAREFYAHFDLEEILTLSDKQSATKKLNGILPDDIAIYNLYQVPETANARFDAISRTYHYQVLTSKNPFYFETAYHWVYGQLDINKMNDAATVLLQHEDFTSFAKLHTQVKTNNCNVMEARWFEQNELLIFTITSNRFLRNMVRAIVGTLLDIGRGKTSMEEWKNIIEAKDRNAAGFSVPAKGLYLTKIVYPKQLLIQ